MGAFLNKYWRFCMAGIKIQIKPNELTVGREFKNYKSLCSVMGWKPQKSGSNGFKTQMKELERHCTYEKKGHKIIITSLHENPLEKIDNRKNKVSEVQQLTERIFIHALANEVSTDGCAIQITKLKLFHKLGYINHNFNICYRNKAVTREVLGTSNSATNYYFERTYDKANDRVELLLNRLAKRGLLMSTYLCKYCDMNDEHHVADNDTMNAIVDIKQEVLIEMGYEQTGEGMVMAHNRWGEYVGKVNRRLNKIGIKYHYMAYNIVLSSRFKSYATEIYQQDVANGITLEHLHMQINDLSRDSNSSTFLKRQQFAIDSKPSLGSHADRDLREATLPKWLRDGDILFEACNNLYNKKDLEPKIKQKLEEKKLSKQKLAVNL